MNAKSIVTTPALIVGLGALLAGTAFLEGRSARAAGTLVQEQVKPAAQEDRSRRVCRNLTPIGTRLTRRVCRTQAEWEESQYKTQDGVLQHQMGTTTTYEAAPRPQ